MNNRQLAADDLVFKTRDNAVEFTPPPVQGHEGPGIWHEIIGSAIGEAIKRLREDIRRELDLLRREYAVLKEEVLVESKLKDLRAQIPSIPDIRSDLEAKINVLTNELYSTRADLIQAQDKIKTLRAKMCQAEYEILDTDKQLRTLKLTLNKPTVKVTLPESPELLEPVKYEPPFHLPPIYVIEHKSNGATTEN